MSFVWNIRETFLGVYTINVWELNEKRGGKKKRDKMAARTVEIISFATTGIT